MALFPQLSHPPGATASKGGLQLHCVERTLGPAQEQRIADIEASIYLPDNFSVYQRDIVALVDGNAVRFNLNHGIMINVANYRGLAGGVGEHVSVTGARGEAAW